MKKLLLLTLGILLVGVGSAVAGPIAVGGPDITGSFNIHWNWTLVSSVDKIVVIISSPASGFEAPGISFVSPATWSGTLVNSSTVTGQGPANTFFDFYLYYSFGANDPWSVNWYALNNNALVEGYHQTGSGNDWNHFEVLNSVPEPSLIVLLGLALVGVTLLARLRQT